MLVAVLYFVILCSGFSSADDTDDQNTCSPTVEPKRQALLQHSQFIVSRDLQQQICSRFHEAELLEAKRRPSAEEQNAREQNQLIMQGHPDYSQGTTRGMHKFNEESDVLAALSCIGAIQQWPKKICDSKVMQRARMLCQKVEDGTHIPSMAMPFLQTSTSSVCSEWHGLSKEIWAKHRCLRSSDLQHIHEILSVGHSGSASAEIDFSGRQCAVVGSSGNLLGAGHGAEIDRHDIVIRFGCAPTHKFEADVGIKTTLRFAYPEALGAQSGKHSDEACGGIVDFQQEKSSLVIRFYKYNEISWWANMLQQRHASTKNFWKKVPRSLPRDITMFVLNPAWVDEIHHTFDLTDGLMSQGIVGVLLGLQGGCATVNVYGFGQSDADGKRLSQSQLHYYE